MEVSVLEAVHGLGSGHRHNNLGEHAADLHPAVKHIVLKIVAARFKGKDNEALVGREVIGAVVLAVVRWVGAPAVPRVQELLR